ncbi:MAG: signal peptide peptidase SppA [Campylobacterota bacterium]|nr:signal peptide peptidase SppA [Campylobacterota bacterium]
MIEFFKKLFLPITAPITFIQNNFKTFVFLAIVALIVSSSDETNMTPHNLQKISLVGPIFDATKIVEEIDEAAKDLHVKGILLSVNSPGGAVSPSIEIAEAIRRANEKKPVVVYAAGTLASGSYYASIYATQIVANPGSMVGSIGVIMQGADVEELMHKVGVSSQVVTAGKYKQVGTIERKWRDYEVAELNKVIDGTYKMFVADVANARGLDINSSDTFANAHIFTAHQAKEVGLVDDLGVEFDAKTTLVKLSGVSEPTWNKEDKFDKILKNLGASGSAMLHTYFPTLTLK